MADEEFTGPIGYVVFTFPDGADIGAGLRHILERVEAGVIEVLDLEVLRADAFGAALPVELADVSSGGIAGDFAGAESSILDDEDRSQIAGDLHPGQFAVAVVYEERSLAAAAHAWSAVGGSELYVGGADIEDLESILDSLEEEGAE